MDKITKKNLERLARHLGLGGFSKIAEEIEEVIEESDISLEKNETANDSIDLIIAEVAMTIYSEIEAMLESNDSDIEEVISELEYVDISASEYTMLEEMILSEFESLELDIGKEQVEELMATTLSKYRFLDYLEDDSFSELAEEIAEDIEALMQ